MNITIKKEATIHVDFTLEELEHIIQRADYGASVMTEGTCACLEQLSIALQEAKR